MFKKACFLLVSNFFILYSCKSFSAKQEEVYYSEKILPEFASFIWPKKVEVFELWPNAPRLPSDFKLLRLGLEDEHPAVITAALKVIVQFATSDFRKEILLLLNHPDNMVRWHAILALESLPVDEKDLPVIANKFTDNEWLVREAALRSLRRYTTEKYEKKYFYQILFRLEEKNPPVLSEVYRTLIWYEDERVYPYLLRRTYIAQTGAELIAMLRELSQTNRPDAINRIKFVARTHSRPDIRFAATELLRKK